MWILVLPQEVKMMWPKHTQSWPKCLMSRLLPSIHIISYTAGRIYALVSQQSFIFKTSDARKQIVDRNKNISQRVLIVECWMLYWLKKILKYFHLIWLAVYYYYSFIVIILLHPSLWASPKQCCLLDADTLEMQIDIPSKITVGDMM